MKAVPADFLALLHCPYCGFGLETESMDAIAGAVRYGILRCACHEYPVVEGIPILQQIDGLQRVVQLIRSMDRSRALSRALDLFRVQWAHRSRLHRLKYYWNCKRLVSRSDESFRDAVHLVRRPGVFADYLMHRYANPSFLAAIGLLPVLARLARPSAAPASAARVLDLACGAGHASYLMQLLGPTLSIVSADQDFVNVYLARRFLVPEGLHLCIDAQAPNPLPDRYFDAVYCQDAFHYVHSKKAAVAELKRVVHPDALWIFPHLHNRLCHNLVPGLPLSPDAYLECFALPGGRLFSESDLLRGLSAERLVDLSAWVPAATLNNAPNLTFVRGGDETWGIHRDFPSAFCRQASALQANPIYDVRPEGNGLRLERRWPNTVMAQECSEADSVVPQSCHLSGEQMLQLRTGWTGTAPSWLEDLVASFVLVPLPDGYSRDPAIRVGDLRLDALAGQARA